MPKAINKFIELMGEDRIPASTEDGTEVIVIGLPRPHHFCQSALVKCACNGTDKLFPVSQLRCNGAPAFERLHSEICLH